MWISDKFKYANDTFGHLFGDSVIKAVAATLRATFRATDIVGRTGGDEFVVLAKDISLSDGLETLKAKCRRLSVELAHVSLGQDYVISASIGISLFPRDGKTYAELFAKADAAFPDVDAAAWYADAVAWASGNGIVTGTGSGFEPDGQITREQLATILYRYADFLGSGYLRRRCALPVLRRRQGFRLGRGGHAVGGGLRSAHRQGQRHR